MEMNLDNNQPLQIAGCNSGSFAFDSYKKTLYHMSENQLDLKDLQDDKKINSIVQIPTAFKDIEVEITQGDLNKDTKLDQEEEKVENKADQERPDGQYVIPETLRFSRRLSVQEISPSGLTAKWLSKDTNKFWHYYSNITFAKGIHYWEIICPISWSGIEFGIKNKETNEVIWGTFRTTTPRIVGMRLDLESTTLNFWLNGRPQHKRNQGIAKGEYYLLVKMKNYGNTVILNPFAQLNQENMYLPQNLLLTAQEKKELLQWFRKETVDNKNSVVGKSNETKQTPPETSIADIDEVPDEGSAQQI